MYKRQAYFLRGYNYYRLFAQYGGVVLQTQVTEGVYKEIIDEILRYLIDKGIGLELNTSGFRYGLGHPSPHEDILERYHDLGGEIITIGADAHSPEYFAYEFTKAQNILKKCGFTYYTYFKERRPEFVKL